ncbi:MAG: AEC family transporter, partial [Saprospiraceae bacterium]|nr:AEC family transporter [Saprospiraceae bacterium]
LRIVGIVFPIFAIVAVGYLYGHRKRPVMDVVNQVNMDVFLPALIFHILGNKGFDLASYGPLTLGAVIVILVSGLLSYPVAKFFKYEWRTFVPPMMFTNYGNLGLPLFLFAFGESALPAAVVLFIVGNLLHFTLGRYMLDHSLRIWAVLRSPIVLASIIGLLFNFMAWKLPQPVSIAVEMAGQVSIPLLLFSLGVRLTGIDWRDWRIGMVGALVCPLVGVLVASVLLLFIDLPPQQAKQLLLFGALPPAVLSFLFAEEFNQQPRQVAAIVMLGNLTAVLTIPLVLAVLFGFGA